MHTQLIALYLIIEKQENGKVVSAGTDENRAVFRNSIDHPKSGTIFFFFSSSSTFGGKPVKFPGPTKAAGFF